MGRGELGGHRGSERTCTVLLGWTDALLNQWWALFPVTLPLSCLLPAPTLVSAAALIRVHAFRPWGPLRNSAVLGADLGVQARLTLVGFAITSLAVLLWAVTGPVPGSLRLVATFRVAISPC